MVFHITGVLDVRHAGVAGKAPIMERRGNQKFLMSPGKDVRSHHQGHYYQSEDQATSLPLPEAQKPTPVLIALRPHFENSKQVHLLTVHAKQNLVFSFASGARLMAVMGAPLAGNLLCVCVFGEQLDAAVNAVPHGRVPAQLA